MPDDRNTNQPSNQPADEKKTGVELDNMNAVDLAEALERLLDETPAEDIDPDVVAAYLDALDRKDPMPPMRLSAEESLSAAQKRLADLVGVTETRKPAPAKAPKGRRVWRTVATVAAAAALVFALLVGAQAAGVNVFGALAKWTNEVFHLGSGSEQRDDIYNSVKRALEEYDFPAGLAPTWYPSGATVAEPDIWQDGFNTWVKFDFVDTNSKSFYIQFVKYDDPTVVSSMVFEKDDDSLEVYTSGQKTFYILSNLDNISATWSDGQVLENIQGSISVEEVKKIIDSIGVR